VIRHAKALGYYFQEKTRTVHLANNTSAEILGAVILPVTIGTRKLTHEFLTMPSLKTPVLIGVDLWAKIGVTLRPPMPEMQTTYVQTTETHSVGLSDQTPDEERRLKDFLDRELAQFEEVVGPTNKLQHRIRLKTDQPIKQRYRPRNPAIQAVINNEVEEMLENGIIEPSRSAWSSPIVVVKKKDGSYRFCIDFRKVNEVTEKDAYPLPHVTATLDKLRGARYLSTLDLKNGYWQVPLHPESRPITAFTVPGKGLFQFRVMPFGLHSAPATFQRLLDEILGPELEPNVLVYLDDIIIVSQTFEDHLRHLAEVFRRLREAKLRLNPEKCFFCREQLRYLGHIIDRKGIRTDPEKVSAVASWPAPTSVKKVRQFLGMASWYRRFVPNFSAVAAPITKLTGKKTKWSWGEEQEEAFQRLKEALTSAPVLACPDFTRRFVLQTDASSYGLGAVLTQHQEDGERVIAYASRTLNNAERNYSATELECLAVVWGIRKMRGYLEGYAFTVVTDHQSLRWLQKLEEPSGRLGRWLFELQQYDFEVRYRKGSLNRVADALSRQPEICAAVSDPKCGWYRRVLNGVRERPADFPDFRLQNGKLFRHVLHDLDFREVDPTEQWKQCVPKEKRLEILQRHHDDPTAGHLGVAKTIARMARLFYWPGMFQDITRYVRQCPSCLAHKVPPTKPAGHLHTTPVTAPWKQVTLDLIGPLPRSSNGHIWLLVMQDRFSKWIELKPLRRATAPAVTRAISEEIIHRHGCPDQIISDNGTQLKSTQLAELLRAFHIEHRTTPVRAPHCNPVERTNRTLKTMVSQFLGKNHRRWDEYLRPLQFAYNTARHEGTGYTPAYLTHGRELSYPHPDDRRHAENTAPHVTRRRLEEAFEVVRTHQARAFQRQEAYYNLRRRNWRPQVGEKVWKREYPLSNKAAGFNAKFAPRYVGPLEVRRIISPVVVDLRDSRGKWHRHIHIQDLKSAPEPTP